ncbi:MULTISPECIES: chloride channel protein [unclassified Spirosoma]|uniref:chloride channel protein n=1 Tax=unclassified Spirosoma TaxID=2621999 RepID=UPI00095F2CB3|nr:MULTISPECIES: chloride channel protein [unclassified Spirosoma]MBN8821337.1 chloride channel protein [Spirosoma sp.]OJW78127.1 MAG: chloride channel protein [Spirosoma sp. 48-14]
MLPKLTRYARVLDWLDQHLIRRLYTERVRRVILQSLPFWVASLLVGLIAVGYEELFLWAERISFTWLSRQPYLVFVLTPLAFVLAWLTVNRLAPAARGSGIPQVMAGIELSTPKTHRRLAYLLSLRVALVKVLSSVVLLLGGGVIGREGPTIQISAAIFRAINRLQPAGWPQLSRQIALVTGGAAGLAAAFNTPLGGIVFVVEELTQTHITRFRTAVFTAVIIAGMTAQAILGPYLYLGFPKITSTTGWFLGIVVLVAIFCGLAGAAFAKVLLWANAYRRRFTTLPAQAGWVAGSGLLLAVLAFWVGTDAFGTGKPIINRLLFQNDHLTPWYLFPVRFAGMTLSYCSGAAGGVFATSLSAGAILGDGLSRLVQVPPSDTNLVILVSMVSFLTGVVRSPFTAAILVLEMTDRHSAIFQLLLGGLMAQGAASLVDPVSFYEHLKAGFVTEALAQPESEHTRQTSETIQPD